MRANRNTIAKPAAGELVRLHWGQMLTRDEIAARFGVSERTVTTWLRLDGVPVVAWEEHRLEAQRRAAHLRELYWTEKLSGREIAKRWGRSEKYVFDRMRQYGIARRDFKQAHATAVETGRVKACQG